MAERDIDPEHRDPERHGVTNRTAFLPGPISLPEDLRDTRLFVSGMIYATAMVARFFYSKWYTRWIGRSLTEEIVLLYRCLETAESGQTFAEIFPDVDFVIAENRR